MEIRFFKTPAEFRKWLEKNHAKASEQWVGFHKKDSGRPSITWPESVDEALCFGWIDGLRKTIDAFSYKIRFTPRKAASIWSAVNVRRMGELIELGLVRPAGLAAFGKRDEKKTAIYAYERAHPDLPAPYAKRFKANKTAWKWFSTQSPYYQKQALYWVLNAKQDATRERRLTTLIEDSAHERRIGPARRPGRSRERTESER